MVPNTYESISIHSFVCSNTHDSKTTGHTGTFSILMTALKKTNLLQKKCGRERLEDYSTYTAYNFVGQRMYNIHTYDR